MNGCLVCHQPVNWDQIMKISDVVDILDRADAWGLYELTESEQLLYEGLLCEDHALADANVLAVERDAEALNLYLAWAVCKPHATYLYGIGVTSGQCPVCKGVDYGYSA